MEEASKRNHYLGAIEGMATYLVVMIHCQFPGDFGDSFAAVVWFAVPMFFAVSGYFYYNEDRSKSVANTKRKIFHLVPMVVGAELFYYLWYVFLYMRKYGISGVAFREILAAHIKMYGPISCLVPFPLIEPACWFVLQLIITYATVALLLKKCRIDTFALFAPPFLIVAGALAAGLVEKNWGFDAAFNVNLVFVFVGLPYFLVGYAFRRNKTAILQVKRSGLVTTILIGTGVFLAAMQFGFWKAIGPKIGHLPIVCGILLFAVKKENDLPKSSVVHYLDVIGRRYSLYIYLFHQWVYGTMDTVLNNVLPQLKGSWMWGSIRPFAACIASTAFAILLYQIKQLLERKGIL